MILDNGICSLYVVANTAAPGNLPEDGLTLLGQAWYGELSFETVPVQRTELQEDVQIDARIRILQDRRLSSQNVVALSDGLQYRVIRVYHGVDKESGELISDISLSKVVSAYAVD